MDFKRIIFIVIISSFTALLYNYLNPQGITLFNIPGSENESVTESTGEIKFSQPININAEEAKLLSEKGLIFIDIRSSDEFKTAHIPNSISIPFDFMDDAESVLASYERNTPLVIYGNKANDEVLNRSAEKIFGTGFSRVYIFPGGFEDWSSSNYGTEQ